MLPQGLPHMVTKVSPMISISQALKDTLANDPGQTIKTLAGRLHLNRHFMAGYLAALEERGEIVSKRVGPARIYFNLPENT